MSNQTLLGELRYDDEVYPVKIGVYLFPFIVRLVWSKKLRSDHDDNVYIPGDFIEEFESLIFDMLDEHLREYYEAPDHEEIVKYRGRYEKIEFNEKTYHLNYRMKAVDKTIYQIASLYHWVRSLRSRG